MIEAMLVMALLALLTAGTTLALRGRLASARMEDATGRLSDFDRVTREAARSQSRTLALEFDLNARTLKRDGGGTYVAGGAYGVSRVRTDAGLIQAGTTQIPFSRRGQSPTYAMLLEGRNAERQWIVIAGLTGKAIAIQDERDLDEIFDRPTRRDAD